MSSIEIFGPTGKFDFSIGGFRVMREGWRLNTMEFVLCCPDHQPCYLSCFKRCKTDEWHAVMNALLEIAKHENVAFTISYADKYYGVDKDGFYEVVTRWDPIAFYSPAPEIAEPLPNEYNDHDNNVFNYDATSYQDDEGAYEDDILTWEESDAHCL